MNTNRPPSTGMDNFVSLRILDEVSQNDALTQRDLSSRVGIALGLVNSYIKNLAAKGYIIIKAIPSKRYAYYLTPKGFTEKTRLTYDLLQDYTRIYREARNNISALFKQMEDRGVRKVVFAGSDEIAEIAYITLQNTRMELVGIVDPAKSGQLFFGKKVLSLDELNALHADSIIVATYLRREEIYQELIRRGIDKKTISRIF